MKIIFLVLLLLTGCSTSRFYHAADVSTELKKNSDQLTWMAAKIEYDYQDKEFFFKNYHKESKDKTSFMLSDLAYRLNDLKLRRDNILAKATFIKKVNDGLMSKLHKKSRIEEKDPVYKDIEDFAVLTQNDAKKLFEDYASYRKASNEFATFAMFTGNLWKKSTSVNRE